MSRIFSTIALGSAITLSGCAAVNSTSGVTRSSGGLMYFMPKRDILITITAASGKITSITAAPSTSYADRSKTYQLDYQPHLLAKNTMDLEISEAGLLTSAKANQTGDAVAALAGLGTLAGYVRGSNLAIQADAATGAKLKATTGECLQDGSYTYLLPADDPKTHPLCSDINVKVERYGWELKDGRKKAGPTSNLADENAYAGIFYRTNLPYKVTITSTGLKSETIVHSPSESETHFLPLARTAFSNNDAKITLANGAGVPSKYVQDTDGEAAALLRLPAAIVAPYFAAIGQIFTGFSAQRTGQATDMKSITALELAKLKYEKCVNAIEARDTNLIASLKCGE